MDAYKFLDVIEDLGGDFFAGVPDSLLCPFIDAVADRYGFSGRHIVAANEGAAVGLAAGHYLAASSPAVVYMQNSGLGNAVNPICSLLHEKVCSIPVIFVIGWRGEPGTCDEPQHVFQGEITLPLLDCLEIPYTVLTAADNDLSRVSEEFRGHIKNGRSVAFVISKGALTNDKKLVYASDAKLSREDALTTILELAGGTAGFSTDGGATSGDAVYVCTTGKLSREVFEIREWQGAGHGSDFLTVGAMGHSLMIAHGIALAKPERRVFCLDGDGSVLMHMGSLAVAGTSGPKNLFHVVINNGAHETVGGFPTAGKELNFADVARTLGYRKVLRVSAMQDLESVMDALKNAQGPVFIEVICNLFSRSDLGRPTTTPERNKDELMANLGDK